MRDEKKNGNVHCPASYLLRSGKLVNRYAVYAATITAALQRLGSIRFNYHMGYVYWLGEELTVVDDAAVQRDKRVCLVERECNYPCSSILLLDLYLPS